MPDRARQDREKQRERIITDRAMRAEKGAG